jgi:N-acetylglutamate synthase-like GNAT family acetyltransferase
MPIKINKASVDDLNTFFSFFQKSLQTQFPQYSPSSLKHFLTKDYCLDRNKQGVEEGWRQIFLAKDDKKIVGYLMASAPYGGVGFCNWIAVSPDFQHQGIATKLLIAWEKQAIKDGAHKLHLWTDDRNLEFYSKGGFVLVGRILHNYFGATASLFYKTIGKPKKSYLVHS